VSLAHAVLMGRAAKGAIHAGSAPKLLGRLGGTCRGDRPPRVRMHARMGAHLPHAPARQRTFSFFSFLALGALGALAFFSGLTLVSSPSAAGAGAFSATLSAAGALPLAMCACWCRWMGGGEEVEWSLLPCASLL
jgi:hypothetical protein